MGRVLREADHTEPGATEGRDAGSNASTVASMMPVNAGIVTAITVRGLGADDLAALKHQAEREGISMNRLALRRLVDKPQPEASGAPSELEALAGTWNQEEAERFEAAIAPLEQVEPGLWG